MPTVILKDKSQRHFEHPLSVAQIASSISPSLAKIIVAARVNGSLVDLSSIVDQDAEVVFFKETDAEGLEVLRHSSAHLLAHAVKELYPEVQVTIGPVIEDGFYYDFACSVHFTPEDLLLIETRMRDISARAYDIVRHVFTREKAVQFFEEMNEFYKVKIIRELPEEAQITVYQQGDFWDLCRGPHVPNTSHLKAFKLTKISGAYWKGNPKNEMLQRIYGTAWPDKKSLNEYLTRLEEAEKRDHRKLAKKMDLFHMQEEAPGMVFWHANGWQLYRTVETVLRRVCYQDYYEEVRTPQLVDRILWEKSGHWSKFGSEHMFQVESEERHYVVKPMNCPCHVQIFKQALKSYRDLPLRLAEFGSCHRNEPSGALHGLMRVRNFNQDDGHIFCTPEQIEAESSRFIEQLFSVYQGFGFNDIIVRFSTRPAQRVGSDEVWDVAEAALEGILRKMNLTWTLQAGEGAFYGPKIEFSLRDCLNRVWQCGTLQLDFVMPERLGAYYIAEDGSKKTPVMLHRAVVGSLERFIGILLEHYDGNLPFWLAPQQVVVLNVTDESLEYAKFIFLELKKRRIRAILDSRNEKIGLKIREHTIARLPYLVIVGKNEVETQMVSVRLQTGLSLGNVSLIDFFNRLEADQAIGKFNA